MPLAAAACPHGQAPSEELHPGTQPRAPCSLPASPTHSGFAPVRLQTMKPVEVFSPEPPAEVKTCFAARSSPALAIHFRPVADSYPAPDTISTILLVFHTCCTNKANKQNMRPNEAGAVVAALGLCLALSGACWEAAPLRRRFPKPLTPHLQQQQPPWPGDHPRSGVCQLGKRLMGKPTVFPLLPPLHSPVCAEPFPWW